MNFYKSKMIVQANKILYQIRNKLEFNTNKLFLNKINQRKFNTIRVFKAINKKEIFTYL
jgi:hypothetical protein